MSSTLTTLDDRSPKITYQGEWRREGIVGKEFDGFRTTSFDFRTSGAMIGSASGGLELELELGLGLRSVGFRAVRAER